MKRSEADKQEAHKGSWVVAKFGGSSLSSRTKIERTASIAERALQGARLAMVVSAPGETTDRLIALAERALRGEHAADGLGELEAYLGALGPVELGDLFERLSERLEGVRLLGELSATSWNEIVAVGERASVRIVARALSEAGIEAHPVDASAWLHTAGDPRAASVAWAETEAAFDPSAWRVPVITGFIGRDRSGALTTLGRDGSDYTATIVARLIGAREVQIWTDVPGVMTADPRIVEEAHPIERLTYGEALELSFFGARVLHPRTMVPLVEAEIPLRILQTSRPKARGTLVDASGQNDPRRATSVTSLDDLALIDVRLRRLREADDFAARVHDAVHGETVWLETAAALGQGWSAAVPLARADAVRARIERALATELKAGEVEPVRVIAPVSMVTVVAEAMGREPMAAGRFFGALGRVGVNVLAAGQGGSARSISAVVRERDVSVRALHDAFALDHAVMSVLVLGHGVVGQPLVSQLLAQRAALNREISVDLRVVGVSTTSATQWDRRGIERIELGPRRPFEELLAELADLPTPVLVDCTAAETFSLHRAALAAGVHVVSANKKPFAGPLADWRALHEASKVHHRELRHETTVGAALPVIQTLHDLRRSGDRIERVEGSLSGTLGFLCERLMRGEPIDEAVRRAAQLGFTEPNPAEDLSGADVARKAIILARELGLALEPDEVEVEPLVPASLLEADSPAAFFEALKGYAPEMAHKVRAIRDRGESLRYLATIDVGARRVTVGPSSVGPDHAAASVRGEEAFVSFSSTRYDALPLRVQGPGAGGEVTAAGVLADILRVADALRVTSPRAPRRSTRRAAT